MPEDTHNQIMYKLGTIEGGIDGIVARLDKLNGSVEKQAVRISTLELYQANAEGKTAVIAAVIGGFVGVIVSIVVAFISSKFQ